MRSLTASEFQEHTALVDWSESAVLEFEHRRLRLSDHLIHIPNGELRDDATAGKLKAMGVKAGVADFLLPVPVRDIHGLWIELKSATGTLSKEQREFLMNMAAQRYAAIVAHGWMAASEAIKAYCTSKFYFGQVLVFREHKGQITTNPL